MNKPYAVGSLFFYGENMRRCFSDERSWAKRYCILLSYNEKEKTVQLYFLSTPKGSVNGRITLSISAFEFDQPLYRKIS